MSEESIPPEDVDVSRGSSASGKLQEEYEELLKHAAVVPRYDQDFLLQSVAKQREEFLQQLLQQEAAQEHSRSPVVSTSVSKVDSNVASKTTKPMTLGNGISTLSSQPDHLQKQETSIKSVHHGRHRPMKPSNVGPRISFSQQEEESNISISDISSQVSSAGSNLPSASLENMVSGLESLQTSKWNSKEFIYDIQPELERMDGLLDNWLLDLKRKILAELSSFHHNVSQRYQKEMKNQNELMNEEIAILKEEKRSQIDLTETFKKSNQNKDQLIENLAQTIEKQKNQEQVAKVFYKWKTLCNDKKREKYADLLAQRHYIFALKKKVMFAWKSLVEKKWKVRVEEACQAKAKEVCTNLSVEYEKTIEELMDKLESSRQALLYVQREKELDEENMKKAFMRGVCALNLETLSAFQGFSFKSLNGGPPKPPSDPGIPGSPMASSDHSLHSRSSEKILTNLMKEGSIKQRIPSSHKSLINSTSQTGIQNISSQITLKQPHLETKTLSRERIVDSGTSNRSINISKTPSAVESSFLRSSESASHRTHPASLWDIKSQYLDEGEINKKRSSTVANHALRKSEEEIALFKKTSSAVGIVPNSKYFNVYFDRSSATSQSKIVAPMETIDNQGGLNILSTENLLPQTTGNEQLLMSKSVHEDRINEIEAPKQPGEIVSGRVISIHHQDILDSVHPSSELKKHEDIEKIDAGVSEISKSAVQSDILLPSKFDISPVPDAGVSDISKPSVQSGTLLPSKFDIYPVPGASVSDISKKTSVHLDTLLSSKFDISPVPKYIDTTVSKTSKSIVDLDTLVPSVSPVHEFIDTSVRKTSKFKIDSGTLSSKVDISPVHEELHSEFKDPQSTHVSKRMVLDIPIHYSVKESSELTGLKNKDAITRSFFDDGSSSSLSHYSDLNVWASELIIKSNQFISTTDSNVYNKSGKQTISHPLNTWSSNYSEQMDSQNRYLSHDNRIHTYPSEKLPSRHHFESTSSSHPHDKLNSSKQILNSAGINQNRTMTMTKVSAEKKKGTKTSKMISTAIDLTSTRTQHPVPCMNAIRLDPPMQSVVVERHLPVNKNTLGHSMASKYCQSSHLLVPAKAQKGILKNVKSTYKSFNVISNNT